MASVNLESITRFLGEFAPIDLAEEWDNVGLLLGDARRKVNRVLTCLTLTPDVAREAVEEKAQLIVTHHPILFRPVKRVTSQTPEGRMVMELIKAGISVYSPHTSYDSARLGINQQIAEKLGLQEIAPIRPPAHPALPESEVGGGRWGKFSEPRTLENVIALVKKQFHLQMLQYVGDLETEITTVAIACGAAAEYLRDAWKKNCQLFLTGEARFHSYLEAQSLNLCMILPGHYATERHGMERLAEILQQEFPKLTITPSQVETDPLLWM